MLLHQLRPTPPSFAWGVRPVPLCLLVEEAGGTTANVVEAFLP